jgi:hypothetical protein
MWLRFSGRDIRSLRRLSEMGRKLDLLIRLGQKKKWKMVRTAKTHSAQTTIKVTI